MDLFSSQSDTLVAAIRAAAAQSAEAMGDAWVRVPLQEVLKAEKERRPPGQMADSRAFAQRYLGNQGDVIRAALRERYPLSLARMPIAPLPYIPLLNPTDLSVGLALAIAAHATPTVRLLLAKV